MLCHVSLVKESRLGVVFTTTILMAKYCTSFISLQCLLSEYYEMDYSFPAFGGLCPPPPNLASKITTFLWLCFRQLLLLEVFGLWIVAPELQLRL